MTGIALTLYGVLALTFMMTMYGLERRHRRYVLAFAIGCALASSYGFASGAWPFGIVEAIWSVVALRRYQRDDRRSSRRRERASEPEGAAPRWPSGGPGGSSPRASTQERGVRRGKAAP